MAKSSATSQASNDGGRRYRRSRNLVAYWRAGSLRILNFATRMEVQAAPIVLELLSAMGDWMTAADAARSLRAPDTEADVTALLDRLSGASILQRFDEGVSPAESAMDGWAEWNPAAGFFHAMTTGVRYRDQALGPGGEETGEESADEGSEQPSQGPARVILPYPRDRGPFPRVLLARRTWRRFGKAHIPARAAGTLLWLTSGVQAWLQTPRGERLALKTSPSGGARHPIDAFVLVRRVRGIHAGLYRYDPLRHQLETVGVPERTNRQYLPRQYWYDRAALIVFFCAQYGKTHERYKYPRAYRAVLLEAGHLAQTFCLTATWLGLAPFSTLALDDRRIEQSLGLDGVGTGVLYAAGVGARPHSGPASAPADVNGVRIRPRPSRRPT